MEVFSKHSIPACASTHHRDVFREVSWGSGNPSEFTFAGLQQKHYTTHYSLASQGYKMSTGQNSIGTG